MIRDIPAATLIEKAAEELKKTENVKQPQAYAFVKSGVNVERPPQQEDFWYIRSAAILRKLYIDGTVGTQRLRNAFGGKRRRGHRPAHHAKAGGKFIRTMLQQLEKEGLVKKNDKPKGRVITPKGQKFLNAVAKGIK